MDHKKIDLSVSNYGTTRNTAYDVALLPWGATEPHNQHLPYQTDCILSHDIAVDAAASAWAKGVHAMVLPPVAAGAQNPGQRDLRFCIHYSHSTQAAILRDIVSSLNHQGIKRLIIVNGHGGNSFKSMIRDLAVDYPDFLIASCEWFKLAPAKDFFENPGDHADELETSVMLHYHPELTDISEAGSGQSTTFKSEILADGRAWIPRNWLKVSTDTGIGDPRTATADKGARFASAVAHVLAQLIVDINQPELYHEK